MLPDRTDCSRSGPRSLEIGEPQELRRRAPLRGTSTTFPSWIGRTDKRTVCSLTVATWTSQSRPTTGLDVAPTNFSVGKATIADSAASCFRRVRRPHCSFILQPEESLVSGSRERRASHCVPQENQDRLPNVLVERAVCRVSPSRALAEQVVSTARGGWPR